MDGEEEGVGSLGTRIYALAASSAAVGFQVAINYLYGHTFKAAPHQHFLWISLATLILTSLIVGWLLRTTCDR